MKRETFLSNIRQQLQGAMLPQAAPPKPQSSPLAPFEVETLIPQFKGEVIALSGQVYHAETATEAYQQISAIFKTHQATTFIAWDEFRLPVPDLHTWLNQQGYQPESGLIPHEQTARQEVYTRLSEVVIGITGVAGALADTGSLVVTSSVGGGRLASLLPPVHIALLTPTQLFPTFAHFLHSQPDAVTQTSNLVLITGPSRTADIEQTLTLGVHGPKELHVILVGTKS